MAAGPSPSRHGVRLLRSDGPEVQVCVGEGETILEGAERQGVLLPFGCRRGVCATCTARLLEGEITHRRPPRALKPRHRADGYVLLCIGVARSECTLRVGPEVVAELTSRPFGGPPAPIGTGERPDPGG